MSVETIVNALHGHKVRASGPDRWRAVCPVCGESNPNTLSVGATPQGAVLVKCFKLGCDIESICGALGVGVAELFPRREFHGAPMQKRRMVTHAQALDLMHEGTQFVALCAANIANGVDLTEGDRARCLEEAGLIAYLRDEVRA